MLPIIQTVGTILLGQVTGESQTLGSGARPKGIRQRVSKGILTSKTAGGAAGSIALGISMLAQSWPWTANAETAATGAGVLICGALALYGRWKADKPLFKGQG